MQIITRAQWGARPPKHAYHKIPKFQPTLILHHAAGAVLPGDDTVSDADLSRIRSIQKYHQDSRGWNDIAYSYLVDPDGNLFEGRGAGVANGATKGYGASSYAICVMGHYDVQKPEPDLIDGLAEVVRWGHAEGLWPLAFSGGHRNYGSTSCPGDHLYPLIPEINRLAQEADMSQYGPEHWDAADIAAFRKHTAGNVWGADGYTIPDPVTGQRVHPNTMLRAIRTDTSLIRSAGLHVDLDDADVEAIADSIAADINALPARVVDLIKARL